MGKGVPHRAALAAKSRMAAPPPEKPEGEDSQNNGSDAKA